MSESFVRGFEAPEPLTGPVEAVTVFEVFEHLTNPTEEMKKLSAITSFLIFSTHPVPEPAPKLEDWWYYGLEHGQQIPFYTRKGLELLAKEFGCEFATNGAALDVLSGNRSHLIFSLNHNHSHQFPGGAFGQSRRANRE